MLAGSCRTSGLGRTFIKWHIEFGIDSVDHTANAGTVRGDGYDNVTLGRGLGISLGEWLSRLDIEYDEPLLTGLQTRAAPGQVVRDPPAALRQKRRQDHQNGDRCGATTGITDP